MNVKLPHLDEASQKRQEIAKRYLQTIKNSKIALPYWDSSNPHVFHLFVIRTENREELQNYLLENGIESMIHYPIAPHHQKAFYGWNDFSFPITKIIHKEILSLPISPVLTDDEVSFIIEILNKY